MRKPPIQKATQSGYVQSAVRLPPQLHQELKAAAEENGRTLNAEIISRLQAASLHEKLDRLAAGHQELRSMLRELLDK